MNKKIVNSMIAASIMMPMALPSIYLNSEAAYSYEKNKENHNTKKLGLKRQARQYTHPHVENYADSYAGGSGTKEDPYLISTPSDNEN